MKRILVIGLMLISFVSNAQDIDIRQKEIDEGSFNQTSQQRSERRSSRKKDKNLKDRKKPPVSSYQIISFTKDTTYVDTTLTIRKDYKFNYLRRDEFGLQPINNVGQTYNSLVKKEEYNHLLPLFGARARHFNFIEAEDVNYYRVPTPLTELYFKTTFEQGQQLDAFLTINTSPGLNLSIAYKGVRSLGKYQHALTSSGNFRATANYAAKNNRYHARTHFVSQDLLNEENGGISFVPSGSSETSGIDEYLGLGDLADDQDRFAERSTITVNFENAESTLKGKRFFLDHSFAILKRTDSSNTGLSIGHVLDITDKSFQFTQAAVAPNNLLGESYVTGQLNDRVALEDFINELNLNLDNKWLGNIKVKAAYTDYNYGYNSLLTLGEVGNMTSIANRIKGNVVSAGATYSNNYKGFQLYGDAMTIVSGDFDGNYVNVGVGYEYNENYGGSLKVSSSSVAPNYNFLLYQSDYRNYNWQNYNNPGVNNNFSNIETQKIQVNINAKKIANLEASYTTIDNHAYFTKNTDSVTVAKQFDQSVNLIKVKLTNQVKWRYFGLDNTIMYQDVSEGENVYRVPQIITRNSLYYEDHWFKKALFLQTGVTFKYYSAYDADGYDPVLSEFYVQSDSEIDFFKGKNIEFGGFPQFDIFFNAKIKQTRIFFKVENFGEAFRQNKEFSAPGYAPRDAVLRFGLVWNFFL